MSKKTRRKKEICPNCKVGLNSNANFCPNCGQENHQKRATVGMLVKDFTQDYWTFDSKLFRSLKPLLFNPGYLTIEFIKGKRMNYIRPIRLYLFISFIYFLVTSLLPDFKDDNTNNDANNSITNISFSEDNGFKITTSNKTTYDKEGNIIQNKKQESDESLITQVLKDTNYTNTLDSNNIDQLTNWDKKFEYLSSKAGQEKFNNLMNKNLPLFLFFTIPILAFLLYLIFYKKERFYVDHLIFALHFMSFFFLSQLIIESVESIIIIPYFGILTFLATVLYAVIAAKKTYLVTYSGSFFRLLGVTFAHAIVSMIFFTIFMIMLAYFVIS